MSPFNLITSFILIAGLIIVEVLLGYLISPLLEDVDKNFWIIIVAVIFSFGSFVIFSVIFIIFYKLSKGSTHHPEVIVTFSPLKLAVDLDSKKCKYRILKNNANFCDYHQYQY